MSEEQKFTFGLKLKSRMIGEFNVGNPQEWNLLIKPQYKDDTLFVHFHCLFKKVLTEEEKAEGQIVPTAIEMIQGFIKEGSFVPTSRNTITAHSQEAILKYYERYVQEYTDLGYIKHGEMYLGKENPDDPKYHEANGKSLQFDMAKILQNMPGMGTNVPMGPANNPPKNPLIRLKAPKKVSTNNLVNINLVQGNQNP